MSDYPTLNKMGITSVDNIDKYSLRHQDNVDVLKVYYKRPQGSFLSKSKKFSFMRGKNTIPLEARNSKAFDHMDKMSPQLKDALEELKQLDAGLKEGTQLDPKQQILSDLDHLERVVNSKINELRQQVQDL